MVEKLNVHNININSLSVLTSMQNYGLSDSYLLLCKFDKVSLTYQQSFLAYVL